MSSTQAEEQQNFPGERDVEQHQSLPPTTSPSSEATSTNNLDHHNNIQSSEAPQKSIVAASDDTTSPNNNNNNPSSSSTTTPEQEDDSTSCNGGGTHTSTMSETNGSTNDEGGDSSDNEEVQQPLKQKGSVSLIITAKSKSKKTSYTKPDTKKQRDKIETIESKSPFKAGSTFVIISTSWLKIWKEYVNYPSEHVGKKKHKEISHKKSPSPGPIDNSDIIQEVLIYSGFSLKHPLVSEFSNFTRDGSVLFTTILKRDITRQDFDFISEESYDLLAHWYGEINNNQKIVRRVIVDGLENNQIRRVETHPYVLNIYKVNEKGTIMKDSKTTVQVSKKMATKDLKMLGCILLDSTTIQKSSSLKNCRMWRKEDSSASSIADSESQTLERALIIDGQTIVFEVKQNGGEFPLEIFRKKQSNEDDIDEEDENDEDKGGRLGELWDSIKDYSFSTFGIATSASGKSKKRGLCGLRNLGNTCFMNSAIQCLSNTVPLKNYFISGQYSKHINTSNPLGTKGKLANNFASLIKEMWSGGANFTPTNFKYAIGQFAPQFSGYNQHDSQELTSYLLDGLHEDLNKVINKPYIEAKDYDGRMDEVIAKESWSQHLKRNDSVIVDLFQGQLKSTLTCNVCDKISVKFDPFMYLSVPVGRSSPHRLDVILLSTENGGRAAKYAVELPKQSTVQLLASQFAKMSGRDPQKLLFYAMNGFSIGRQFSLNESVKIIDPNSKSPKVLCVDVPDDYSPEKYLIIHLRQRYPVEGGKFKSVGIPFILFVKREISTKELYDILWSHLQRVAKKSPEDPETNLQPEEYPVHERVEILRQTIFPTFDPENIPFKFSAIDKSVEVINDTCGIPILYDDRDDMAKEYLQQYEQFIFSVDWFDVAMLKTKEVVTVHVAEHNLSNEAPKSQNISLDDCLKLNSEMEQLGERDQWYCPECKKHVCAFKQCSVWSSPEILIIHLKRFGFNRFGREKVNALIDYPVNNLDLSDYMVRKPEDHMLYDLFAISCHTGGLYGGHYYSYAKNCEDNRWYCFDDSSVSPLIEKELKTSNAYMLFYQRKRTVSDVKVDIQ